MEKPVKGGCQCGAIRYEISGEPDLVYYCHCHDCQKSTGSAFHCGLMLNKKIFKLLSGEPKGHTKLADSGNEMTREFCPECGSPLFTHDSGAPNFIVVKAGSLDDPARVTPNVELWTHSKVPWAKIKEGIKSLDKGKAIDFKT